MTVPLVPPPTPPPPPRPVYRPSPAELLAVARAVSGAGGGAFGGSWARAATFLIRQALERAVDTVWTGPLAGVAACPRTTTLLCLRRYLGDDDLAADVHATWAQLSSACHAHAYELEPTLGELRRWGDVVDRLIAALAPRKVGP